VGRHLGGVDVGVVDVDPGAPGEHARQEGDFLKSRAVSNEQISNIDTLITPPTHTHKNG
jgi:hypothetical protein